MTRTLNTAGSGFLLPPGTLEALRRRLLEAGGLGLFLVAAALLAALLSYAPGDPSFNSATDSAAHNLLGRPGAYAADVLLQTFGIVGGLPALVLVFWGWKLFSKRNVSSPWLRLGMLGAAMIQLGMAASAVAVPDAWPLLAGFGGIVGGLLLERLNAFAAALGGDSGMWLLAPGCAALGAAALFVALDASPASWRAGFGSLVRGAVIVAGAVRGGGDLLEDLRRWRKLADSAPEVVLEGDAKASGTARTAAARTIAVAPKAPKARLGRRAKAARQGTLDLDPGDEFRFPPLELLEAAAAPAGGAGDNREALKQNARLLETVLDDFGVRGEIIKVRPGPVVTLYELEPAPGTKTSRVIGLSDDIARSMSAVSVRIAVVPGRNVIGIELPNTSREMVHLRELLASDTFERSAGKLKLALGKDISGTPMVVDLARMPHLLIAGTTGSGKSVGINTIILSLIYQLPPDHCKLIMIDPKMLELSVYEGIPHLLCPVVTEPAKAVTALKWAVREMEERYRAMSQLGVRNVAGYNARLAEALKRGETLTRRVQTGFDDAGKPVFEDQPLSMEPLPFIVVVVDEMADLMLVAGKDIETAVQRLSQMARAAGIHVVMATQRPSVDVITGTIKANFPTRVSFQVTSRIDSRTILGEQGAEQLLGQGDMLYMAGGGRITRVHGPFVSDNEVEAVVRHLKTQGTPAYLEDVTADVEGDAFPGTGGEGASGDVLYDEAVALITREGKASTSFIQRHLQIGYNRAARIIERMEDEGLVSQANRVGRREVLIGG